jgi:hypothetical protein
MDWPIEESIYVATKNQTTDLPPLSRPFLIIDELLPFADSLKHFLTDGFLGIFIDLLDFHLEVGKDGHMLIPHFFDGRVLATDDLVVGGVPDAIGPPREVRIEGVLGFEVLVGGRKLYLLLLIVAVLQQAYVREMDFIGLTETRRSR